MEISTVTSIESISVLSKREANPLSKIQKIVCSVFKIAPQRRYYFRVQAKCESQLIFRSDIAMCNNLISWLVVGKTPESVTIENLQPIGELADIKSIRRTASVFVER